MLFSINKNLKL
jgi:hypothetical protein